MELRVKKPALALAMGVLVLALAGVGCGDDDGGESGAGGSGGTGGSGGSSGTGGSGGTGGTGGTGGGEPPTAAECQEAVDTNTSSAVPETSACAVCLCDMEANREAVVDCTAGCWAVVDCVQEKCAGLDDNARRACAFSMCAAEFQLPGGGAAVDFSPVILGCAAQCIPSDMDAGDTDSGT